MSTFLDSGSLLQQFEAMTCYPFWYYTTRVAGSASTLYNIKRPPKAATLEHSSPSQGSRQKMNCTTSCARVCCFWCSFFASSWPTVPTKIVRPHPVCSNPCGTLSVLLSSRSAPASCAHLFTSLCSSRKERQCYISSILWRPPTFSWKQCEHGA